MRRSKFDTPDEVAGFLNTSTRFKKMIPKSLCPVTPEMIIEVHGELPEYNDDDLFEKYGLGGSDEGQIIKDVLGSTSALGYFVSPSIGREILYSPLYWEDNPDKVVALAGKHELGDIAQAIGSVRRYQGFPEATITNTVLLSVSQTGILPTTTVTSTSGPKRFLFTPIQGVKKLEKPMLDKALALVSSIRYGQHHAQVTRLRYSAANLLQILKDRKRIGPHSEILGEYSPVVNLMLGKVVEGPTGRYTFIFDDTDENMRALDIAIEIASIGETMPRTESIAAATRLLLPPGTYREPTRTRIELRHSIKATGTVIKRISDIISGVSPDVI